MVDQGTFVKTPKNSLRQVLYSMKLRCAYVSLPLWKYAAFRMTYKFFWVDMHIDRVLLNYLNEEE